MNELQLAVAIMALGLVGCFLPLIPGPLIIWLGTFTYAWHTGWREVSLTTTLAMLLLAVAGSTADVWMSMLGARKTGASIWGTVAGMVGGTLGLVVGSIPGLLVGSLLAIGAVEYFQHRSWGQVLQVAKGYLAGFFISTVAQVLFGIALVVMFVLALRF